MAAPVEITQRFPPVRLGFELNEEEGFTPPPGIAELRGKDSISLSLGFGVHYYSTCISGREPSFKLAEEFLEYSRADDAMHRFTGTRFTGDSEDGRALSTRFAKLVGISFMSQHADATWFAPMESLWDDGLLTPDGTVTFKKQRPEDDGPDYLAAPFDPTADDASDPLVVLEFKGRSQRIGFDTKEFGKWRNQAINISCFGNDGNPRNLKSWVLEFAYAFENTSGSSRHSAFLVDDPHIGPTGAPPLERERLSIERIVREHLTRQCYRLGAGRIARSVLLGERLAPPRDFPTTYLTKDMRLHDRRFIGLFGTWGVDGELVLSGNPRILSPMSEADVEMDVYFESGARWAHVRIRGRPDGNTILADIHLSVSKSDQWTSKEELEGDVRRWLIGNREGQIFIGQDATMLRTAIATARGQPLEGTPFTVPIQFSTGTNRKDGAYAVQVLRNGAVFADARAVTAANGDDREWWMSR